MNTKTKILAALLDALIDATDNCLWRSDSDIPLSADESQRIYNKAMAAIAKAKQFLTVQD